MPRAYPALMKGTHERRFGGHPRIKKRQDRGTPTENHTQIHQRLAIDRLAAIVAIAITKKETFYA